MFHSSDSSKLAYFSLVMMSPADATRVRAPSTTCHPDGIESFLKPRQPAVVLPSNSSFQPGAHPPTGTKPAMTRHTAAARRIFPGFIGASEGMVKVRAQEYLPSSPPSIPFALRFEVAMRVRLFVWLSVLVSCGSVVAAAQRPTGVVGAYVPPRAWPQEPRRFDLLRQKIEIRFDVPHRQLIGTVTTRVAITQGPTDTVRLNAENLTIDAATDARGHTLRFTADTAYVTVRLPRRAAMGDTVEFILRYHGT